MTLQGFLDTIGMSETAFWSLIIFLASIFIDWRPEFKWNPWRSLIKWIGSNFNTHLDSKLDTVRGEIKALDGKVDYVQGELDKHISESESKALEETRALILDFANACMNGRKHTKEQYAFMLKKCDQYEKYTKEKYIQNGEISDAIEEIHRLHKEHMRKNDFLKEGEDPVKNMRDELVDEVVTEVQRITNDCPFLHPELNKTEFKEKGEQSHEQQNL